MFTLVDSSNYQSYLENKDIRAEWKERDFTTEVRKYLDSSLQRFFLFDCKHAAEYSIYNKNISLVNGRADDAILEKWPDSEIVGRYIVHPGADSVQTNHNGTEVLVINQDKCFYQYYDYEENRKLCSVQNRKKDAGK